MSPKIGKFSQYVYFTFAPTLIYRDHYPMWVCHNYPPRVVITPLRVVTQATKNTLDERYLVFTSGECIFWMYLHSITEVIIISLVVSSPAQLSCWKTSLNLISFYYMRHLLSKFTVCAVVILKGHFLTSVQLFPGMGCWLSHLVFWLVLSLW